MKDKFLETKMTRRTKIVATIGPASREEATLRKLIEAGLDVARLNFSHGTHAEQAEVFHRLRKVSAEMDRPVTIMQDLQGPKIRTGEISGGQVELKVGQILILTEEAVIGDAQQISVDLPGLVESLIPGSRVLLDDGNLELEVVQTGGKKVVSRVVVGGILKPNKGVNLPGLQISIPGFTDKDRDDLSFGLELGVDAVAVSFVRTAQDVEIVRQAIREDASQSGKLLVIAKLERPEALDNLEAILHAADGVMVARGDLGVEMSPEAVPIAQKRIISSANRHGRIVITATQMLESMINNPRPTRAEASDVANAIFDGTDAVMLSGETATGKYPLETIRTMHAIICQAESNIGDWGHWHGEVSPDTDMDDTYYMTRAASELARDRNVAAIAVFTQTGKTALMLSKIRPAVPIMAFTPNLQTYSRINLYWGVKAVRVQRVENIEGMFGAVEGAILATGHVQAGQQVVLVCGYPIYAAGPANLALLYTVGTTIKTSLPE